MKNFWKMETSRDYTSWDLNCRSIVPHTTSRNKIEKIIKRKNRRKIKKYLTDFTIGTII